jgi:Ser/Thr protein kinase RdoA (MazF antagonist)
MSDVQTVQLENLCNVLGLGELVKGPTSISGGLLHKLFAVETNLGKYAIKLLNPQIMNRTKAMMNFIQSEQIANVSSLYVPALPARIFNGSQEQDQHFFLVFDWFEGKTLKQLDIHTKHCEIIGSMLASIHKIDFSRLNLTDDKTPSIGKIDWEFYLDKGIESNAVWVNLLSETIDRIYEWNEYANKSENLLSEYRVISHRDLDAKNVLWNQDTPLMIDWESAGFINPMQDMVETAIYWSETETGTIDEERFFSFVKSYKSTYGPLHANWNLVLSSGYSSKLGWLEYSLKRSLWLECSDEKEQQMGTEQVIATLNTLIRYEALVSKLEQWLNNV